MPQRTLRHDFCDFFHSACTAGKRNKCLPHCDHLCLPLGHILCDNQLCQALLLKALIDEKLGFYSAACMTLPDSSPIKPLFNPP